MARYKRSEKIVAHGELRCFTPTAGPGLLHPLQCTGTTGPPRSMAYFEFTSLRRPPLPSTSSCPGPSGPLKIRRRKKKRITCAKQMFAHELWKIPAYARPLPRKRGHAHRRAIFKFLTLALRLKVRTILPRQEMNVHSRRIRTNQSTLRGVRISAGRFGRLEPA
jgi:hypothetical protein